MDEPKTRDSFRSRNGGRIERPFATLVFMLIVGGIGFVWLDESVQWFHELTPWGHAEKVKRDAESEARRMYLSMIEPTRKYHRVIRRFEDDEDVTWVTLVVQPLYQDPSGEWIETTWTMPSGVRHNRFEILRIEEKNSPSAEEHELLVKAAEERMKATLQSLSANGPLEADGLKKSYALREALTTPLMMESGHSRKEPEMATKFESFKQAQLPLLTDYEIKKKSKSSKNSGGPS